MIYTRAIINRPLDVPGVSALTNIRFVVCPASVLFGRTSSVDTTYTCVRVAGKHLNHPLTLLKGTNTLYRKNASSRMPSGLPCNRIGAMDNNLGVFSAEPIKGLRCKKCHFVLFKLMFSFPEFNSARFISTKSLYMPGSDTGNFRGPQQSSRSPITSL